jgi:hypothetical protein
MLYFIPVLKRVGCGKVIIDLDTVASISGLTLDWKPYNLSYKRKDPDYLPHVKPMRLIGYVCHYTKS